jgi:hypothetical protein
MQGLVGRDAATLEGAATLGAVPRLAFMGVRLDRRRRAPREGPAVGRVERAV